MALTSNLGMTVSGLLTGSGDLAVPSADLSWRRAVALSSGTGAGAADKMFSDTRTLAASATEDLDLAGVLLDSFGSAITFAKVKGLFVSAAAANTNNVIIGAASATAWAALLGATGTLIVRPGATVGLMAGVADATGYVAAAGSTDLLKVANSSSGTGVTYDILIIGTSA